MDTLMGGTLVSEERKEYLRKYHREYYKIPENRLKRLEKERKSSLRNKELYIKWKSTLSCSVCGECEPCCLEMHHKNPDEKEFSVSKLSNKSFKRVIVEAEKCICLCSNCHKKVHAGLVDVEPIELYKYTPSTQE